MQMQLYYCPAHKALFTHEIVEKYSYRCPVIESKCPKCKNYLYISVQDSKYSLKCLKCGYSSFDDASSGSSSVEILLQSAKRIGILHTKVIQPSIKDVLCNAQLKAIHLDREVCFHCIAQFINVHRKVPFPAIINLINSKNPLVKSEYVVLFILSQLLKSGKISGIIDDEAKMFYLIPKQDLDLLHSYLKETRERINLRTPPPYCPNPALFKQAIHYYNNSETIGVFSSQDLFFYPYSYLAQLIQKRANAGRLNIPQLSSELFMAPEPLSEVFHVMTARSLISGIILSTKEYISTPRLVTELIEYIEKNHKVSIPGLIDFFNIPKASVKKFIDILLGLIEKGIIRSLNKELVEYIPQPNAITLEDPKIVQNAIAFLFDQRIEYESLLPKYRIKITNPSNKLLKSPKIIIQLPAALFEHTTELVALDDIPANSSIEITEKFIPKDSYHSGIGKISSIFNYSDEQHKQYSVSIGEIDIKILATPAFSKESVQMHIEGLHEVNQAVNAYDLEMKDVSKIVQKIKDAYCSESFYSTPQFDSGIEFWAKARIVNDVILKILYSPAGKENQIAIKIFPSSKTAAGANNPNLSRITSFISSEILERLMEKKVHQDSNYNIYMITHDLITLSDYIHLNHDDISDLALKLNDILERMKSIEFFHQSNHLQSLEEDYSQLRISSASTGISPDLKKHILEGIDAILLYLNRELRRGS